MSGDLQKLALSSEGSSRFLSRHHLDLCSVQAADIPETVSRHHFSFRPATTAGPIPERILPPLAATSPTATQNIFLWQNGSVAAYEHNLRVAILLPCPLPSRHWQSQPISKKQSQTDRFHPTHPYMDRSLPIPPTPDKLCRLLSCHRASGTIPHSRRYPRAT